MNSDIDLIADTKRKMLIKYPRFGSEIATANIEYRDNLKYHTAATDGKNVYVDPKYFNSLSENDRLFTIAHEIMHIKFMHMYRLKGKSGIKKDLNLWNIATDAIINANLERDGFTIKEGYVNMPEALNYSAEEFYQKLLQEKEKPEQEKQKNKQEQDNKGQEQNGNDQEQDGNGQEQDGKGQEQNGNDQEQDDKGQEQDGNAQEQDGNGQEQDAKGQEQDGNDQEQDGNGQEQDGNAQEQDDNDQEQDGKGQEQDGNGQGQDSKQVHNGKNIEKDEKQKKSETQQGDDHSLWEEAFEKQQKKESAEEQKEQTEDEQTEEKFDEKQEFEDNRKEKREKFKSRSEKTKKDIREIIKLDNIGETKEIIDWKILLRREVEKTETIWSQRRSIAENNYSYRIEENEIEDDAETEVMIDVSGSVNLELVKAFLRHMKPLIKQSKLKVGCFNENFWGFVDIKNIRDIDNFTIPQKARGNSAWTEDWDLAVRSFTKKREINKIVFTDGFPAPGTMPKEDLKRENIIWLVYGNKDFNPCCGKVINITKRQLEQLHPVHKSIFTDDMSR